MWVAEDMAEYKTNLAAKVFNDLLKPIQAVEMEEKSAVCDKVEHKEAIDNEQQEEVRTGRHL